jgi:CubicO group peptidase (beta-lactamase class C family)
MYEINLHRELQQVKKKNKIPGIAAAIYLNENCAYAAVGKRKLGCSEQICADDKWRVGSCTKPMTATLAGILIDQGLIHWNTTIAEVFASYQKEIHKDWHRVTLEHLLAHHSGATRELGICLQRPSERKNGTATQRRMKFALNFLSRAPEWPPDSRFQYSNAGYSIAGIMLEACTKLTWENLMTDLVFKPLNMVSAGFNEPDPAQVGCQPVGHALLKGKLKPIGVDDYYITPEEKGPGATVHCSILDFLKFAVEHPKLVSDDVLQRMRRPYGASEVSSGWWVFEPRWGNGKVLCHDGCSWGWNSSMRVAPLRGAAFVVVTNDYRDAGRNACNQVVNFMSQHYL